MAIETNSKASRESTFDSNRIWAKSDGTSLLDHIEDCLRVYSDLCLALPAIPSILDMADFFDLLFYAVYLHDWGKAHLEFQKVLKGVRNQWLHGRHELYSVPFAGMLGLPPEPAELVCLAILGHHKDLETLVEAHSYTREAIEDYGRYNPAGINPLDFSANMRRLLDFGYLAELKKRFRDYYRRYVSGGAERRFKFVPVNFASAENPIESHASPIVKGESRHPDEKAYWQRMLLLGTTRLCDHMGSAKRTEIPRLAPENFSFLDSYEGRWYSHQKQCGAVPSSLFLIAPTGSGKTEAAMNWLRGQFQSGHQGRVFYVLPYTASINAMHRRLIEAFERKGTLPGNTRYIGIMHGKVSQYLARYYEEVDEFTRDFQSRIKSLKELHRQMVHPLKVVTPFQILKHCYGVRGFETGFAELAGAMLIFDEIHAYDVQTFAQIVVMLGWLTRHLKIRTTIMTATLPSFMLAELRNAIGIYGDYETVKADDDLLATFTRHRVQLLDGSIFDQMELIRAALREGLRVIVVCNTVANAQAAFRSLAIEVEPEESVLLHSRFTPEDRFDKEQMLDDERVRLLVGTQAIEVSLDIDFDVIFSEPAPLDALIQRFGRVNRRRTKGICTVYVCTQGGEYDGLIYPSEVVERTIDVLGRISVIEEGELQQMLDKVYPDWPDRIKYEETRTGFLASVNRLMPFMRHKEEDEFYERFDGVSVLPVAFQNLYEERMARLEFLQAENLFVSLHRGMFHKLLKSGLLERAAAVVEMGGKLKQFPYLLANCRYDSRIGLIAGEKAPESRSTLSC